MGDRSKIEWTDATCNPLRARHRKTGRIGWHCEKISAACANCYAAAFNQKGRGQLGTGEPYNAEADVEPLLALDQLFAPLRWQRPRKIFMCSMTDLFGDWVPDEWIAAVFGMMAMARRHTFQVLTKRAERMEQWFRGAMNFSHPTAWVVGRFHDQVKVLRAFNRLKNREKVELHGWPLPNVWVGVTAEDQERADERIPHLMRTPAAKRFVSAEPLLGRLDLTPYLTPVIDTGEDLEDDEREAYGLPEEWPGLDQVIVGGESGRGPQIRPMHPRWALDLRNQCQAADVAFYFKQWGEWVQGDAVPGGDLGGDFRRGRATICHLVPHTPDELCRRSVFPGDVIMRRVGKKAAGRLLDGREWSEFPQLAEAAR